MSEVTEDMRLMHEVVKTGLGDDYLAHLDGMMKAVKQIADEKQISVISAAAHLADVAQRQGEAPLIVSAFFACGVELADRQVARQ